jgi:molybdopterin-containing oxidoreductase family membrane subunit
LLCLLLRRVSSFDVGREAIQKLGVIVTYAMSINVFFIALELFTVFYSRVPEDLEHFEYVFLGLDGHNQLAHLMWLSIALAALALVLLLVPTIRANEKALVVACFAVFTSLWLDKGMGLIVGGFVPSPLGVVTTYSPTGPEWTIVLGIWAIGALLITVFYKIVISVREVPRAGRAEPAGAGPAISDVRVATR